MIPKLIAVGAAFILVSVTKAAEGPEASDDRVSLACSGSMVAAGQAPPGSRIMADGLVDLFEMRVGGFGIGRAPIVSVTTEEIKFGASLLPTTDRGHSVEGTIDRLSGETRILIRSAKAPRTTLITMELDCRPTPLAGH